MLALTGCSEPDALPAHEAPLSAVSERQLTQDAKSIEEAAEKAVKLIETVAEAEIAADAQATEEPAD